MWWMYNHSTACFQAHIKYVDAYTVINGWHKSFPFLRLCIQVWTSPLTFIGACYPLQRGDIVVMLANRESENTNLIDENNR